MMELSCENSKRLKVVNYFCNKISSWIFEKLLNIPLEFPYDVSKQDLPCPTHTGAQLAGGGLPCPFLEIE